MSDPTEEQAVAILGRAKHPAQLDLTVVGNKFSPTYKDHYEELLARMLDEFPAIEGYETAHALAVERLAYLYTLQKQSDNKDEATVEWKNYKFQTYGFIKTFEALLKEAKNIGVNNAFKAGFVREVLGIIERQVKSKDEKKRIIAELRSLAARS